MINAEKRDPVNNDRVSEALDGAFGEEFQRETQQRCDWIADKALAENVLDVGCSQGAVSLLLAAKGACVVGVDNEFPSIDFARRSAESLPAGFRDKVTFVCADFLAYDAGGRSFDSIVMTEVLEHVFDPSLFLEKARVLLAPFGKLIVTVPFGISPHHDHKRTYYLLELLNELKRLFSVDEVVFFGKWIGFVAVNDPEASSVVVDETLLSRLEDAFYRIDSMRLGHLEDSEKRSAAAQAKLREKISAYEEECLRVKKLLSDLESERKKAADDLEACRGKCCDEKNARLKAEKSRDAYVEECLRAKGVLRDVDRVAERYKKEYSKVLRSRTIKAWLKLRKMMGREYVPYKASVPKLAAFGKQASAAADVASVGEACAASPVAASMINRAFAENLDALVSKIPSSNGSSYYQKASMSAGIITDDYMYNYYRDALDFRYLSPDNYREVIDSGSLSFILFVSCWRGLGDGTDYNSDAKRKKIVDILNYGRSCGIPVLFQTIEDPTNYERYIHIAKVSDVIFTTDSNMVNRYIEDTGNSNVFVLEYGVNPTFHNPIGFLSKNFQRDGFADSVFFAGSWYERYPDRCADAAMLFDGIIEEAGKGMVIADRNSVLPPAKRTPYLFPEKYRPYLVEAVDHEVLQKAHRLFDYSASLSTIKNSPTMCAMRVYELQAMGCLMLSNYAYSISSSFPSVFMISSKQEVKNILRGYSKREVVNLQLEGIRRMFSSCTVYDRLNYIFECAGIEYRFEEKPVYVLCDCELQACRDVVSRQTYKSVVILGKDDVLAEPERTSNGYAVEFDAADWENVHYLEDAINAFKFVDTSYVCYGDLASRNAYDYVEGALGGQGKLYDCSKVDIADILNAAERETQYLGFQIASPVWGRSTHGSEKKLAVIVPVYNNGVYLRDRCFLSLLRSSIFDLMQIYLVDDGSTDSATKEIISELGSTYDNVTTYFFDDGGSGSASRARNKGLELCEEPYVTYLDPDNEAINDGYARLFDIVESNDVDFAVGTILKIAAPNFKAVELSPAFGNGLNANPKKTLIDCGFKGQSVQACVVRKGFLVDSGIANVEGAIGQDTLFFYEMMLNAKSFYCLKLPIHIYYAERTGSAVNAVSKSFFDKSLKLEKGQVASLKKYGALDDYKRVKLEQFMQGWYEEKYKLVASEDKAYARRVIDEIWALYGEDGR